ncbi:MAG: nucleoside triphosphate pyrophosphohydrolase [Treponema sp.]|nr:nucleoside triphosphate pyrophosphohydrolase [Treponema sp.]
MEKQPEQSFLSLLDIVAKLRSPEGCPWDREQTSQSLRGDLVEETYECIEAISENDPGHIKEELGDLFFLVIMIAHIFQENGSFSVSDVMECTSEKLIRRHPHVFAGTKVKDTAEVLANWDRIKVEQEGRRPKDSVLDEVKGGLPPLERAYKLQKKAAKTGFDWADIDGVFDKFREELDEAKEAVGGARDSLEDELGDVLFMAVNLCRFLKTDPSIAMQKANSKFIRRFGHVEKRMKETGQEIKQENLAVMDSYWDEAKHLFG